MGIGSQPRLSVSSRVHRVLSRAIGAIGTSTRRRHRIHCMHSRHRRLQSSTRLRTGTPLPESAIWRPWPRANHAPTKVCFHISTAFIIHRLHYLVLGNETTWCETSLRCQRERGAVHTGGARPWSPRTGSRRGSRGWLPSALIRFATHSRQGAGCRARGGGATRRPRGGS